MPYAIWGGGPSFISCFTSSDFLSSQNSRLGYTPTEEQRRELHSKIDIDEDGYVVYLDFVNEAKKLFAIQIDERQFSSGKPAVSILLY